MSRLFHQDQDQDHVLMSSKCLTTETKVFRLRLCVCVYVSAPGGDGGTLGVCSVPRAAVTGPARGSVSYAADHPISPSPHCR